MKLDYKKIQEISEITDRDGQVLAAAVMYAEQGFYVLPIRPNEKAAPQKKTGLNYSHASKNPKTVTKWYTGTYAGWNVGLCCGAEDGIFVLDVDNGETKNGFPALADMVTDHGEFNTVVQTTPRGGRHYIFTWFEQGRSSTDKLARGIDTRGGDGSNRSHIVAWPSTINGKMYEWQDGGKISTAPDWLADLLGEPWNTGAPRGDGEGRGNENVDDDMLEQIFSPREIWLMLKSINVDEISYEEWLQMGQAVHSQHPDDTGLSLWDKWSSAGERYEVGECAQRWDGFKSYGPIRIGTLIYFAKQGGYQLKPNVTELDFEATKSEYEDIIEEMNKEYGIAVIGGKIRVISTAINSDPEQDLQLMTLDDFKALTMNKKVAVTLGNGQVKPVPKSMIWLGDEGRKEYRGGVHFTPNEGTDYETAAGLVYNIWRGWQVTPARGDWSKLRTHIEDILCAGKEEHYTWLLDWMADIFQDPANPKGCAVVMHGIEGCGKGTFMEAMGRTMGRHYKHITQEEHMTGRFNGHLQDALLIFADEVIYGGSKKTAGNLKAMVTEPKLTVERKGIDAFSFRNRSRIGIASNEDWFIPAGPQSRRWFVLDVLDSKANNEKWFGGIYEEMINGGLEAMMEELMKRTITSNLKKAPETKLLQDQRERYADSRSDSLEGWWYDCLEAMSIEVICFNTGANLEVRWPTLTNKAELYKCYFDWANKAGTKESPMTKPLFYRRIETLGVTETRPASAEVIKRCGGVRTRMFVIPEHDEALKIFTKSTGKTI